MIDRRTESQGSPSQARSKRVLEPPPSAVPPPPPAAPKLATRKPKPKAGDSTVPAVQPIAAVVPLPPLQPVGPQASLELRTLQEYTDQANDSSQQDASQPAPIPIPPRATEPADQASYFLDVPQVSFLPKRLVSGWAAAITEVIKDYKDKDAEERNKCIQALLRCPAVLLPQSSKRMGDRSIPIMTANEIAEAELPARRPAKSKTVEERTLNRASTLAIQGLLSRAVSTLMRDTDVPELDDDEKVDLLRALHPKRVELVKECFSEGTVEVRLKANPKKNAQTSEPQLKSEIRKWCSGKAAGPSGWTEELIRDAVTAANAPEWMSIFEDIVNASLNSDTLHLLRRANLLGWARLW